MKTIVVAYDQNRVIGRDADMPWVGKMRDDMQHFTESTVGNSVIMGRRTYESIPEAFRPLSHRQNIVVSLTATSLAGVEIVHSLDAAYAAAKENIFVIGGGQIYAQALPDVDRVIATEIDAKVADGDTYFPALPDAEWVESSRTEYPADTRNMYPYAFVTYLRKYRDDQ